MILSYIFGNKVAKKARGVKYTFPHKIKGAIFVIIEKVPKKVF